ncbi:MAG: hypothetical protein JW850_04330 [Thermoflexales bacterium]|nr:hypothetical protein [Thermoflexales bacterium]
MVKIIRLNAVENWEHRLALQVRRVELLGEIPITADECGQLGQAIGQYVNKWGHDLALRTLQRDYPCAFAVYLVAQGMYGYQGGDYWSGVIQTTGLDSKSTAQIGQAFEQVLRKLGLPLFYDMREEKTRRYVSLILAHGGIPDYCLPEFFFKMLQPSVVRAQYVGMTAAELIDEWLWRSSIDMPVLYFLTWGGQVAANFVERCREMAQIYLDARTLPDAKELGLPERVVASYYSWIEGQDPKPPEHPIDRWHLYKPEMRVDPWGEGVFLDLLPQPVPATMSQAAFAWWVKTAREEYTIPVRVHHVGHDTSTASGFVALTQSAPLVEVSFLADGDAKRTWRYQGVDDKRPLLAFDPEQGTLIAWRQDTLPARRLGLLYPANWKLQEGHERLLEELPRMPGGWSGFRGEVRDLSQAACLNLIKENGDVLVVLLRPDESMQRPHLVGGRFFTSEPGSHAQFYVGNPPCVRISLTGRREVEDELARWRLTVRNEGPAAPEVNVARTLADLRSQLDIKESSVDLPLSMRSLLGPAPFGNYAIRLRGPLGRDAGFTLRLMPHLEIYGQEALYLPDPESGSKPVTLLVETWPGDSLEFQGESEHCRIVDEVQPREGSWKHRVELASDVTRAELTIVRALPPGGAARVPVTLSIRRLRWALGGEQMEPGQIEWSGHIIKRPLDALLQAHAPYLLVTWPLQELKWNCPSLRLLDGDDAELQVLSTPSRIQQGWCFKLGALLDTIRVSPSSVLRLELVARNVPGQDVSLRLPVLSLIRTLMVDHIELSCAVPGNLDNSPNRGGFLQRLFGRRGPKPKPPTPKHAILKWHEPTPLKNRNVRFWSLWRPWDPPLEYTIPDTAEGMCSIDLGKAPSMSRTEAWFLGKYRLEFFIADPWVTLPTPDYPPPKGTPGTADIALITPDERLKQLGVGPGFGPFLERAFIYHEMGKKSQPDWQECLKHLDEGTIPQVLALADLIYSAGDMAMRQALQQEMFKPRQIGSLLHAYGQGAVSPDQFNRYMSNLPTSSLPKNTCIQLLAVEDKAVRLRSVQDLLRQQDTRGVDAVLEWVQSTYLSEADAVAFLESKANLSAKHLKKHLNNPVALRVLKALAWGLGSRTPVVWPGFWVHTDAGWGRIEKIENRTGRRVEHFLSEQADFQLHVTLRPDLDAESIIVDLAENQISFPNAGRIYTCTKCNGFSARDWNLIANEHNKASHGGLGPKFHPEGSTVRQLTTLEYNAQPIAIQAL